ncbi:hypothetical protein, partial [Butyricicoccus sp.]|uniref:hypothetical protein n=1 Tax=Butyricicoccus sp. TaxID=2049021 RepID=UPI003F17B182
VCLFAPTRHGTFYPPADFLPGDFYGSRRREGFYCCTMKSPDICPDFFYDSPGCIYSGQDKERKQGEYL